MLCGCSSPQKTPVGMFCVVWCTVLSENSGTVDILIHFLSRRFAASDTKKKKKRKKNASPSLLLTERPASYRYLVCHSSQTREHLHPRCILISPRIGTVRKRQVVLICLSIMNSNMHFDMNFSICPRVPACQLHNFKETIISMGRAQSRDDERICLLPSQFRNTTMFYPGNQGLERQHTLGF